MVHNDECIYGMVFSRSFLLWSVCLPGFADGFPEDSVQQAVPVDDGIAVGFVDHFHQEVEV
jgi:hypothetical protein